MLNKSSRLSLVCCALVLLSGCGGGGSGLGLSGGSIPTGGTITGKIALPSGGTLTSSTTTATSLATSKAIAVNTTINPGGHFTITNVPLSTDIALTFVNSPITLKVVIPATQVTSAATPVDIGSVNASTTVTAEAIETEIAAGVDDPATIVSTQLAICSTNQDGSGEDETEQDDDIHNPTARHQSVNRLITKTADSDMNQVAGHPTPANATSALVGVLSYTHAQGGEVAPLTPAQRKSLTTAQTTGAGYTQAQIVSALNTAGGTADVAAVTQADKKQRQTVPAFGKFANISAMEAVALAGCPSTAGGFALTSAQLSAFVDALTST